MAGFRLQQYRSRRGHHDGRWGWSLAWNSPVRTAASSCSSRGDGIWNYTYDAAGNETQKVNIADGKVWNYFYDNCNRLVKAEKIKAGGRWDRGEYSYNALNWKVRERRVVLPYLLTPELGSPPAQDTVDNVTTFFPLLHELGN